MEEERTLGKKTETIYWILVVLYFGVATFEICAEFLKEEKLIICSKPFLMPLLASIYLLTSKRKHAIFLVGLVFTWIANLFFISKDFDYITIGTFFFTAYRVLMIILVIRLIRIPGAIPLFIGCLPFLFIYLFVINLTYDELEEGFWLFLLQGIFTIVFGGLSLGSYIFKSNKANTYLLISTMLFTFTQFLFVIRLFYTINIFQPLAMLLYVVGQFMLYKFIIIAEEKLRRHENITAAGQDGI